MNTANRFLAANDGNPVFAAAAFALALMEGDPDTLRAGYTRDNAILAAVEAIPADAEIVGAAVDVAIRGGAA